MVCLEQDKLGSGAFKAPEAPEHGLPANLVGASEYLQQRYFLVSMFQSVLATGSPVLDMDTLMSEYMTASGQTDKR